MPRLPRISLDSAIYYVISKGLNGQSIFKDKADCHTYLDLLTRYKTQHRFKIFSYCLLPDHLELLIQTGDGATISQVMHDLNSSYTKYFNGRYGRHGHLFESRFRSVLVEKTSFLLPMTRHIHLAPFRNSNETTGSSGQGIPPFTSFDFYLVSTDPEEAFGSSPLNLYEEAREVMDLLKNGNTGSYERYCLEGDKREIEDLEKNLRRGSVLGSESFRQEVQNRIQEHSEASREELTGKLSAKTTHAPFYLAGVIFLTAVSYSTYLYISKANLENRYEALLRQKEVEFVEKTKFENQSPIALAHLAGTVWDIEMISLPADKARGTLKDKIRFIGGRFSSDAFAAKGFRQTNFSLTRQGNGVVTWETIQSAPNGDTVAWRGDWQGDVMKGVVSLTPANQKTQDFSFFSLKWVYEDPELAYVRRELK